MDTNAIKDISTATVTFEQELERLVLEAYGVGATVEGIWEFETPLPDTPNWRISVRKEYSDPTTPGASQDQSE